MVTVPRAAVPAAGLVVDGALLYVEQMNSREF